MRVIPSGGIDGVTPVLVRTFTEARRAVDQGVSTYAFNSLTQLVTGDWSGQLSAFGPPLSEHSGGGAWTQTAGLASLSVNAESATVFQRGDWTAKGLTVPAGDTTLTVVRTAQDQTQTTAETTVTRPADGLTYAHDLNGNMLGDGSWTYTWNEENRLVRAEGGNLKAEFVYDGQGRRRVKREFTWNAQTETWQLNTEHFYTWDGWLLVSDRIGAQFRRLALADGERLDAGRGLLLRIVSMLIPLIRRASTA